MKIRDAPQVCCLGKFITLSAKQEDIVENAKDLPLVVSGSAGSGKTSVALEKLRKIEEEFKKGRILYITKSENLIKRSKELYEYVYWDETANDFKIGIPDRIEFLSLHEFLEKQAEGIKGKKPVDRNKFFSWFNEICKKDKFKEYKKDGDKIFEEFTAVIAGGGLKKEQYKKLGSRQAIFSKEEREHIYSLFEDYKKFIEKDSEYYDPNLIAHKCTEEKVYNVVVIDEVQDLTESTLSSILKSLKDGSKDNFLLCGDVNQVIHPSFFSLSKLKSFLHKNAADKEPSVCFLEKNYRNSQQVIELSNRILHFKNYCFASEDKITEEEKKLFFMKSDTENEGNVDFTAEDKEQEMARKVPESINWAVLVLNDESKEDASRLFNTPLVFNIHEAKGLEFKNVILYKFMSHEAYNEVWNIAKKRQVKRRLKMLLRKSVIRITQRM
ncbi:Ankyrin repeat domain protein [Wolbachia endosymbiont of Cylisticus convexus]|uniref:UvrD-helicase domain-containing protein n=1 Tax=Wolbachia endosymbiont of Cylisticus convexus TaxID=118728 RepID=UPI000E130AFB|nr:UvrD-helicase domain-containing protein [Wolbachia endosymbiont of Cylisticus convexus]RDD34701.1 Ankyrin repeat domain protein [Wolbachia endosymbiont of Cylisticus convexus]